MNRALKIVGVIAVLILVPKLIGKVMFPNGNGFTDEQASQLAREMNSQLPKTIEPGVILEKIELEGKTLRNNYRIEREISINPSSSMAASFKGMSQVCGSPLRRLTENGFTVVLRYNYRESGAQKFFDIAVPPGTCA